MEWYEICFAILLGLCVGSMCAVAIRWIRDNWWRCCADRQMREYDRRIQAAKAAILKVLKDANVDRAHIVTVECNVLNTIDLVVNTKCVLSPEVQSAIATVHGFEVRIVVLSPNRMWLE